MGGKGEFMRAVLDSGQAPRRSDFLLITLWFNQSPGAMCDLQRR